MALAAQIYFYNKGDNGPFYHAEIQSASGSVERHVITILYMMYGLILSLPICNEGDFKSARVN